MNFYRIQEEKKEFYSQNDLASYPIVKEVLSAHFDREIIRKIQGLSCLDTNMVLVNYQSYISILNPDYCKRMLHYILRANRFKKNEDTVLLSPSMITRFPKLVELLSKRNIIFYVTAFNNNPVRDQSGYSMRKIHHLLYGKKINTLLGKIIKCVGKDLEENKKLRQLSYKLLDEANNELEKNVRNLMVKLKEDNVSQYISAFSNRYDEILLGIACNRLGIPTKEVAHGINSYTLETGDTLVPKNFDYLYVWHEHMRKNILDYGCESSRIKVIGYPKMTKEMAAELSTKYKQRKKITYFSQPIYDILDSPLVEITSELRDKEKFFRETLLNQLISIAKKYEYEVTVRYHNGESDDGNSSRVEEKVWITTQSNIEISKARYEDDLFSSEVCVGVNSSCLFEACIIGKKVAQIRFEENKNCYHKMIAVINSNELITIFQDFKSEGGGEFLNVDALLSN